jgi:hypothetical protein
MVYVYLILYIKINCNFCNVGGVLHSYTYKVSFRYVEAKNDNAYVLPDIFPPLSFTVSCSLYCEMASSNSIS